MSVVGWYSLPALSISLDGDWHGWLLVVVVEAQEPRKQGQIRVIGPEVGKARGDETVENVTCKKDERIRRF